MSINKDQINEYFAVHWRSNHIHHEYTNVQNILAKIGPKDEVLDIGCGYNPFKEHLGNRLYAFDPALPYGDEVTDIENFDAKGKQWDVVLCLGSINFGSTSDVKPQVQKAVSLVKPGGRIIWRQNPGKQDHGNKECQEITFFKWSQSLNYTWAEEFGCSVPICMFDYNKHKKEFDRIYAIWQKK